MELFPFALIPIIAIALLVIFNFFVTISQGSIGVVTVFGKYRRIMTPGLNLRIPIIEVIYRKISIQNYSVELEFQAITAD
jgi:regulator of protease activity HflC (stomatin/prohibitin superfamily)